MADVRLPEVVYVDSDRIDATDVAFTSVEADAVAEVRRQVARCAHLDEIMDQLFESTLRICACERIGLGILEEGGDRAVLSWARAAYEPLHLAAGRAEDTRLGNLTEVIRNKRCRIIPDLERYARSHPEDESAQLLRRESILSTMVSPLVVADEVVGLLHRGSLVKNAFDEHQIQLQAAIAEPLAQAVWAAVQIEALEEANHAYLEMLGFVSHELKNPVASIVTDVRVLLEGYLGSLAERQSEQLTRIVRKAEYLLDLIKDYLDLARIEDGRVRPNFRRGVDFIAEVVEPSMDLVQPAKRARDIELETFFPASSVGVECDASMMRIVMTNLLDNAVKYGETGGRIRLHVNRLLEKLAVSVWNSGPGFPESEQAHLFRRFSRLKTPELAARRGTGIGLYSSWRIVRLHHGTIRARSSPGEWAEFTFEIPQPIGEAPAGRSM